MIQFTYGEIEFLSLACVIKYINTKYSAFTEPNQVFVDLGSGLGKGVLCAAMSSYFTECIGIEFLEELYKKSQELATLFELEVTKIIDGESDEKNDIGLKDKPKITMINGDFHTTDWSSANLILANATCYLDDYMDKILNNLNKCKPNTWFICITRKLPPNDEWERVKKFELMMSWDLATNIIINEVEQLGDREEEVEEIEVDNQSDNETDHTKLKSTTLEIPESFS